ncbi:MAG: AmmeMemoRadiSam system protein A [Gammaproteobacteria bacterium]|nr:AmmeMemoRadiSam system protein A [Gammaproteobacteria bacterium]NNJ92629.1 AmmeMemoRadiSam system protein A [Gammaproteobacteria bacterium]
MKISAQEQDQLLALARDSITYGLEHGRAINPVISQYDDNLQQMAACFVTLTMAHDLRGCIGHLSAIQPLFEDVAENAFSAAFRDPRFPELREDEINRIEIEISILTPSTPMEFTDEDDLLKQIQEGIDGLILEDGYNRGTFLPTVWESLPDKQDFWKHLKMKAGLPVSHWSDTLKVSRYHTISFSE